jgi:hypothetical protein
MRGNVMVRDDAVKESDLMQSKVLSLGAKRDQHLHFRQKSSGSLHCPFFFFFFLAVCVCVCVTFREFVILQGHSVRPPARNFSLGASVQQRQQREVLRISSQILRVCV